MAKPAGGVIVDRMTNGVLIPSPLSCPRCANPAPTGASKCGTCGLLLTGPQVGKLSLVGELRWIDGELAKVDRARSWLINRRATLLAELTSQESAPAAPQPAALQPAATPRPELSGRAVARFLLVAGALLVVIAAAVFTVANWSSIGALGRCSILLGLTAMMLAAPRVLIRRQLTATAEAIAGIGLALTLADAYLTEQLFHLPGSQLATAGGCAVLAGAWAGYGWATKLRVPAIGAIGLAQGPALPRDRRVDPLVRALRDCACPDRRSRPAAGKNAGQDDDRPWTPSGSADGLLPGCQFLDDRRLHDAAGRGAGPQPAPKSRP